MKLSMAKALFVNLLISVIGLNSLQAQKKNNSIDNDPTHSPKLSVFYGIGVGSTPHFYFNLINRAGLSYNFKNITSVDLNYEFMMKRWNDYLKKDVYSSSHRIEKTFNKLDFKWNLTFFEKTKDKEIKVFSHQEYQMGSRTRIYNFYEAKSPARRYFEGSLGFLYYNDIMDQQEQGIYSKTGELIDFSHLNYNTTAIQAGVTYNSDVYYVEKTSSRTYQQIKSSKIYLLLVYAPSINIEKINYEDRTVEVDESVSAINFRRVGFKSGFSISQNIIGNWSSLIYGSEVAIFPGIKGYPKDIGNLNIRLYAQISLNFFKKFKNKSII